MTGILNFVKDNPDTVVLIVSLILAAIQAMREHMKAGDAILLLLNTLKDENKLENGEQFTKEAVEKLEKVAEVTETTKSTINHVKKVIGDVNRKKGIKIGSYHHKPIYLRDAAQLSPIGKSLGAALGVLKGIIGR